jgi:hypothetical protein
VGARKQQALCLDPNVWANELRESVLKLLAEFSQGAKCGPSHDSWGKAQIRNGGSSFVVKTRHRQIAKEAKGFRGRGHLGAEKFDDSTRGFADAGRRRGPTRKHES